MCLSLSGGRLQQDLPEGNYLDLKKRGVKEKANTLREMKVAFRCSRLLRYLKAPCMLGGIEQESCFRSSPCALQ